MPNYCHCGQSRMQPYCDGSHDGRNLHRQAKAEADTVTPAPPAAAKPEVAAAPRGSWLARLFGKS